MTVLLGVSMGTRAVRTAQPRAEQVSVPVADRSGLVTDIERPLFFRNEVIDSVGGDLPHLAAESIGAAAETEPELSAGVAYRDARQADALHAAFAGAHLHNYRLVHEVEAVVEYLAATGEARDARSVALFDLGSSGLTVSVVDLVNRTVTASQRSGEFSGDLLDAYVRNNQLERLGKKATDPDIALFEKRCRIAKERLSTQDAVCLPDASGMILLSRENFELLVTDVIDEAIEFARAVMIGANAPIDAVVLIGGGARMPIVQTRVGPLLELPSIVPTEPETVAARGAALAARPHSRTRTAPRAAADASRPAATQSTPTPVPAESGSRQDSERPSAPTPPPRAPRLRPPPPRPPTAGSIRPVPARAESAHAAPAAPASVPSTTRPVPARPWIAAASAAGAEAVGNEAVSNEASTRTSSDEATTEAAGTAGGFESSKFSDLAVSSSTTVAAESISSPAVVDDVPDDHVQGAQVDGEVVAVGNKAELGVDAAVGNNAGDRSAEALAEEPAVSETGATETGALETGAIDPVADASESHAAADHASVEDAKPVPFQLQNIYWLDADYDDDDGEDDRTRTRRRLRTGGVLALGLAAVTAVSGFMLTHENTPQVVDTSVSRTQTEVPAATTVDPTSAVPTPVLPPPAPIPETTVEPTTEAPETTWEQPVVPQPVTTEPTTTTSEPAPPPPVESVPPTTQQPPPLIPGFPDFTLPVFPPLAP